MKILVIYTGGTIGMVKDELSKALKPGDVNGIEDFLRKENLIQHCHIKSTTTLVDSSNFNKQKYTELSSLIKKHYFKYDAFLVLMGTDTMAYISSLLSFCTQGLNKTILFTGGQKTLYEPNSDSVKNLRESIKGLTENRFPNEVGIYFSEKWHRAVCATKKHSNDFDAYESVIYHSYSTQPNEKFEMVTEVYSNIAILKITPFDGENILATILKNQKINAIILEIFGSGNMPNLSTNLQRILKKRIQQGLKVVVTSQCAYGGLEIGRYESSLNISSLGFLNAGNMTKEAIVGKLMFLVEKKLNIQDFSIMFEDSLRGE